MTSTNVNLTTVSYLYTYTEKRERENKTMTSDALPKYKERPMYNPDHLKITERLSTFVTNSKVSPETWEQLKNNQDLFKELGAVAKSPPDTHREEYSFLFSLNFNTHPNIPRFYYHSLDRASNLPMVMNSATGELIFKHRSYLTSEGVFICVEDSSSCITTLEQGEKMDAEILYYMFRRCSPKITKSQKTRDRSRIRNKYKGFHTAVGSLVIPFDFDTRHLMLSCTGWGKIIQKVLRSNGREGIFKNEETFEDSSLEELLSFVDTFVTKRANAKFILSTDFFQGFLVSPSLDVLNLLNSYVVGDETNTSLFRNTLFKAEETACISFNTGYRADLAGVKNNRAYKKIGNKLLSYTLFATLDEKMGLTENLTTPNNEGRHMYYSKDVLDYKVGFKKSEKDTKDSKIMLGIELEVVCKKEVASYISGIANSPLGNHLIMKADSSIRGEGEGVELVTVPATLYYHKEIFDSFFFSSPTKGTPAFNTLHSINTSTGMHVHIDKRSFTKPSLGKFIAFINKKSNRRFVSTIAGRDISTSGYCVALNLTEDNQKGFDVSASVGAFARPESSEKKEKELKLHTNASSIDHLSHRGRGSIDLTKPATIELRIFSSSSKRADFYAKLEFTHALVKFCKTTSMQQLHYYYFLKFVASPENKKDYPNLVTFLSKNDYLVTRVRKIKGKRAASRVITGQVTVPPPQTPSTIPSLEKISRRVKNVKVAKNLRKNY